MEEVLLNIDSRYRDILIYPNEAKFRFNLEKMYKNIISARMISVEVNNSATYLDNKKANNFITIHLPDKINDPDGIKIQLDEGLYQIVGVIQNMFNGLLQELFNTNGALKRITIDGKPFSEKYFYFFYLNSDIELLFDFNSNNNNQPASLASKLTLKKGWYSVYGLVLQIQNYIKLKYNERVEYKKANPGINSINLDSGNFVLNDFKLPIFDRRFRVDDINDIIHDCIRYDPISQFNGSNNNLTSNLDYLKEHIYKKYINDINKFILQTDRTYGDFDDHGILDDLNANEYEVSNIDVNYTLSGSKLLSKSIYHLNIAYSTDLPTYPTEDSTQIYNLLMQVDLTSLKVSFSNYFTKTTSTTSVSGTFAFYYYYSPFSGYGSYDQAYHNQKWSVTLGVDMPAINKFDTLFSDKEFLYQQKFITSEQYNDPFFEYTAEKDIPQFEINFSTYPITNPVSNGLIDIQKMVYPPVGYYLGYRPDITKTINQFIFKGTIDNTERILRSTKIFDTTGDDYMFLRINEWGYIDFFSRKMFAKVLLTTGLGNPKIDDYVNKEFRFRQPIDINRLDIELVDYLGNTIDLGGFDWSFTLELKQLVNSTEKTSVERNALVFNTIYKS